MDRRTFLKVVGAAGGAVVVGLPLAGCAAPAAPKAKTLFEAQIGGTGLYSARAHSPILVGEAKGFFAEEGIKNLVTEFQGAPESIRGITEGGLHYVVTSVSAVATAFMQGTPIRAIAGEWPAATSIAYAVKADSPYKTLQDLKGKKIGFSRPAALPHFFILKAIKSAGLSDKDFNLVPVGGVAESNTALMTGVVDASWIIDSLAVQGTMDQSLRVVFWAYELVKDWMEGLVITKQDFIKSNPDLLRGFLRAYQKSLDWESKNRDEAARVWAEAAKIDLKVATQLLKDAPKEAFTIKINPAGLKVAEESLRDFKLLDKPVPWRELIDQSLLPAELQSELPA